MWQVEQRHQQAQKTALNPLECAASSVPGQVHPQPHDEQNHCWVLPAAQSAPLTGILLSRFFAHLHLASVCFAAILSKPPLLMWIYKHQDKLYRSNFFKMRHLYSALSWGSLPATQARDFFGQLGRLLLLGITRADFKLGLFQSWSSHFNPPELFFSDSLVCCWLLDKDEPRPIK